MDSYKKITFETSDISLPTGYYKEDISNLSRLIIKLSGGKISDPKQIQVILAVFAVIGLIISAFIIAYSLKSPVTPPTDTTVRVAI